MTKPNFQTPDLTQTNIDKIAALFPNCITEARDADGKLKRAVNFDQLRQMLSKDIADGDEAYEFTWVGKKAAIVEANTPIRKTLRPCKEESVNWDTTENLYIEGDNLEVLKLLQESYLNKVKMIYIDPPYNTGNDFIYRDDFTSSSEEYAEESGLFDDEGNRLFKNTDSNGRFHSDWCSMIYSRLMLARNLLTDDGVIFISIDDNEVENLKKICDEVFGEKNKITNFIWQSTPGSNTGTEIKTVTENVLCYAKDRASFIPSTKGIEDDSKYNLQDEYVEKRSKYVLNKLDRRMTGNHYSDALNYPIKMEDGSEVYPGGLSTKQGHWNWRWSKTKLEWGIKNGFIVFKKADDSWSCYFKQYFKVDNNDEEIKRALPYQNLLDDLEGANSARGTREVMDILEKKLFDYPKPLSLVSEFLKIATSKTEMSLGGSNPCDTPIILDFFSGSATTAHAVMQLNAEDGGNRKFIMVQLPEKCDEKSEAYKAGYKNICEIGKERIRRAGSQILKQAQNSHSKEQADLFAANAAHPEKAKDVSPEQIRLSKNPDIGFRVLKVDSTNMKDVYYSPLEYKQENLEFLKAT